MSSATVFSPHHGRNIRLSSDNTVARRVSDFCHGVVFSAKPLMPGEIFLVEIEDIEPIWSGHLCVGLTQLCPENPFDVPRFALPDLDEMGNTWTHVVIDPTAYGEKEEGYESVLGTSDVIMTPRGKVRRDDLKPLHQSSGLVNGSVLDILRLRDESGMVEVPQDRLSADVGSRVGIMFKVTNHEARMHFILNGEDQGPSAHVIPYHNGPLFVVVDVYGVTKQIRIVQLYGMKTLLYACRDKILEQCDKDGINTLPLPNILLQFLNYEDV